MNRLRTKYIEKVAPEILTSFKLSNVMQVPALKKISVNAGVGPFRENREALEHFVEELTAITSQKPFPRKAKASEAGFKVRKGEIVGYTVTLRGDKMWAFLDKLINIALPRVRDFRGIEDTSFDKNGNYSLGIKEHVIFPEVNPNTTKGMRSLQMTLVFNTKDIDMNRYLLTQLGMPFRKDDK